MTSYTGETTVIEQKAIPDNQRLLGPKKWADCSADEKIERLRQEIDGWRRVCADLRDRLQLFETHRHGEDGKLLITLEQADRQRSMNQCSSYNNLA